ncbi:MAG: hypothetical protein JWR00_2784 [Rubritepida sp.]|nr:hypothetical protein [Rubritepida sp.]
MSSDTLADTHADTHGDHGGAGHGTIRDYLIGFVLSVILTAIPFWLVMERPLADGPTGILVMGFAVIQILVHMVYFLHMNGRSEGGWTMIALIFTLIVVAITMTGSLWVMYHLNANMMPMPMPADARVMP